MAAHSSQLPGPHAYRCEDILDVPVLLVRDAEGKAHAYLNSCSHRGARLLNGEGKIDGRIRCSYHAWSYSPKGELLRSEAHKSELQSLMRISYAVFCLKNKKANLL